MGALIEARKGGPNALNACVVETIKRMHLDSCLSAHNLPRVFILVTLATYCMANASSSCMVDEMPDCKMDG